MKRFDELNKIDGVYYNMCDILVLPEDPSIINKEGDICMFPYGPAVAGKDNMGYPVCNIHILSDESIGIDQFGIDIRDCKIFKCERILTNHYESGVLSFQKSYCKRIIASTKKLYAAREYHGDTTIKKYVMPTISIGLKVYLISMKFKVSKIPVIYYPVDKNIDAYFAWNNTDVDFGYIPKIVQRDTAVTIIADLPMIYPNAEGMGIGMDGVIALQGILGAKAMEYCKQYKGTDKYDVAMEAITFGYGLAEIEHNAEIEHILYKHTEDLLAGYRGTLEDWMKENKSGLDLNEWLESVRKKQSKAIKPTDNEKK